MNEKQTGELVVDGAVGEMSVNSIIQSQKIMSEETGHSILIKRTQARKNDGMLPTFLSFRPVTRIFGNEDALPWIFGEFFELLEK